MSVKTKKYLITTEKHEFFVIRGNQDKTITCFCLVCQAEVELLTLDSITTKTGKSTRRLLELIASNSIHSIEVGTGHLMICSNSLQALNGQKFIDGK